LSNVRKLKIVFLGDSNNMSHSWLLLSGMMGLHFVLACPNGYDPDSELLRRARQLAVNSGGRLDVVHDPQVAAMSADVLYTDVWTSMGQEKEKNIRLKAFKKFCVDFNLIERAKKDVIVMHCLPAHRGEEITSDVLDSKYSVVFD